MSEMTPIDVNGATLEEAINRGLRQLGLSRNDVIVEIVDEGSQGILGVGAREASVRLVPLRPPRIRPEPEPEPEIEEPISDEDEEDWDEEDDWDTSEDDWDDEDWDEEDDWDDDEPETPETFIRPTNVIDDEALIARETLSTILQKMGYRANISIGPRESEDVPWLLDVTGAELGALIGRKGQTLDALQYLTRLIVSRKLQRRVDIVVDVEGYKARREETLRKLAERMASQATRVGRTVTLEPMPPNERRIIHMTLRDHEDVKTESVGSGNRRRVTIIPLD